MPEARLQDDIARGVLAAMRGGGDTQGPTLRQLLLRGQYQEATEAMVALAGQLRSLRGRSDVPAAAGLVKPWAAKVQTAYAEYLRAQRAADLSALNDASAKLEALLKEGRPLELYVQWLAAGQMLAKLDFMTALAKHDQAEARHRRDPADAVRAWQTAIAAWRSYLANHPTAAHASHVRRLLGRALDQSGQRDAAAQMYREAAAKSTGPDKSAAEWLAARSGGG
jgi:tetratricopeptide (TPR) repeat protein